MKLTNTKEVLEIFTLEDMHESCPWKEHQGKSIDIFIKDNFKSLKDKTLVFDEILSKKCIEITFVKLANELLEKEYWVCIYLVGENEAGIPRYFIGGEPELNPNTNELLKEAGWGAFPEDIAEFWKVHGVWREALSNGKLNFGLEGVFYMSDGANVKHYSRLSKTVEELDHYLLPWDDLDEIQVYPLNLPEDKEWYDSEEDTEDFLVNYLKNGIHYTTEEESGNDIFLLKSYKGLPTMLYFGHGCSPELFMDFWEYISSPLEHIDKVETFKRSCVEYMKSFDNLEW